MKRESVISIADWGPDRLNTALALAQERGLEACPYLAAPGYPGDYLLCEVPTFRILFNEQGAEDFWEELDRRAPSDSDSFLV